MFQGLRYSEALGDAAEHSFPNIFPHRFAPDEHDPGGTGRAEIPYILVTEDGMHARIKTNRDSPWWVSGSRETGYELRSDASDGVRRVNFEPAQGWQQGLASDGVPRAQSGLRLHGDMVVVNVAPGCEYFLAPKRNGDSMRCTFCTYGAPDVRMKHLGQQMGVTAIPEPTYRRLQEVLSDALAETEIRHIYLVGGSFTDPREEGIRFAELARRVQEVNDRRVPVTCGSGALPEESLRLLHDERLVENACFNLEVWSEPLFSRICPGKERYIGYEGWLGALEAAVRIWGRGHVYSAMVAGVEFEPELDLSSEQALDTALRGARDLCQRGIIPIYSLYWPPAGRDLPEHLRELRSFFERLQLGYHEIRHAEGLEIWEGFMCQRCSYMQLECDIDRALASEHGAS
jgi:hypothetical protein